MVKVRIQRYPTGSSSLTNEYYVEGMLELRERKSQLSEAVSVPFLNDSKSLLPNVFGQNRELNGSFLIFDVRDSDYQTGATSGPYTNVGEAQRIYLLDTIFTPTGQHAIIDEHGNAYNGRITEVEIIRRGDDPLAYDCTFRFVRGITVGL